MSERFVFLPWFDVAITCTSTPERFVGLTLWVFWREDVWVPWDSPLLKLKCGPRSYTQEQSDVIHEAVANRQPLPTPPLPIGD